MLDTDSILHPDNFTESTSDLVKTLLEAWDKVRDRFDFVHEHLEKVVNKIIRKQNEIHSRVEQKRPWANASYHVTKFENLGNKIRVFAVDTREIITGENKPIVQFDVDRNLCIYKENQNFISI